MCSALGSLFSIMCHLESSSPCIATQLLCHTKPFTVPDAGALGVLGLALAVGGITISSITSSGGGGGGGGGSAGKAAEPVKQLLDRVPQPLPVTKKAEQAATQVTSQGEKRSIMGECPRQFCTPALSKVGELPSV